MSSRLRITMTLLATCFLSASLSAQKHIEAYDPEALFNEEVLAFQNQEYGAALTTFEQYRAAANDAKSQRCVDAQYYEAVSAMYLGHADGSVEVQFGASLLVFLFNVAFALFGEARYLGRGGTCADAFDIDLPSSLFFDNDDGC